MHDPSLLSLVTLMSSPWAWVALVLALLLCFRAGRGLVLEVLIFIDRCFNVLFGGIWRETLSSRAHRMRAAGSRYSLRLDQLNFFMLTAGA